MDRLSSSFIKVPAVANKSRVSPDSPVKQAESILIPNNQHSSPLPTLSKNLVSPAIAASKEDITRKLHELNQAIRDTQAVSPT